MEPSPNTRETDLAWAAGFLDGEGCFAAYAATSRYGTVNYTPVVTVGGTDRKPVDDFAEIVGAGRVTKGAVPPEGWSQAWHWRLANAGELVRVVPLVLPYLRLKGDQAQLVLALAREIAEHGGRGVRASASSRRLREDCVRALASAKSRNRGVA